MDLAAFHLCFAPMAAPAQSPRPLQTQAACRGFDGCVLPAVQLAHYLSLCVQNLHRFLNPSSSRTTPPGVAPQCSRPSRPGTDSARSASPVPAETHSRCSDRWVDHRLRHSETPETAAASSAARSGSSLPQWCRCTAAGDSAVQCSAVADSSLPVFRSPTAPAAMCRQRCGPGQLDETPPPQASVSAAPAAEIPQIRQHPRPPSQIRSVQGSATAVSFGADDSTCLNCLPTTLPNSDVRRHSLRASSQTDANSVAASTTLHTFHAYSACRIRYGSPGGLPRAARIPARRCDAAYRPASSSTEQETPPARSCRSRNLKHPCSQNRNTACPTTRATPCA